MSTGGPVYPRAEARALLDARRSARRKRALALTTAVVVGGFATGAGALVATDTLRIGGGTEPALAERTPSEPITAPRITAPPTLTCREPLTSDDPLRLWIGGDSLAGSLGPALGEQVADTGVVLPTFDSRVSSGLSSPDFFDWPEHATEELARLETEVVVFIIGTNDYTTPRQRPVDADGEPEWKAQYAAEVEEMLDVLNGDENVRPVYWIGAPTLQEDRKDSGAQQINDVARDVVEQHPEATYVDAYELFAGPDGGYAASLPDDDGDNVRVRAGDGVHLTPAGGELLGDAVFELLDERCNLGEQADPDNPQPVREAPGSGRAPGSGSGSSTTKPPATSPPTSPPTDPPTSPPTTVLPPIIPTS